MDTSNSTNLSRVLPQYIPGPCSAVKEQTTSVEEFWRLITETETPLIEPDPDEPGCNLVTFIARHDPDATHLCVSLGFGEPVDNKMQRIVGTDILYLSYRFEKDTRLSYGFVKDMPLIALSAVSDEERKAFFDYMETAQIIPDPFNPSQVSSKNTDGEDEVTSLLCLENCLSDDYSQKRDDITRGWLHHEEFASDVLGNRRDIWVYEPPGYDESEDDYPVLLFFDGGAHLSVGRSHRILDNLIADKKIPPVMAVFIDNAPPPARSEELPCSELLVEFIETELIPWLNHHFPISPLPIDWTAIGASYGGLASVWLAYKMPFQIGNVISQSGSFWWGRGYSTDEFVLTAEADYEAESMIRDIADSGHLPLRIWLEVGKLEAPRMMKSNRAMRDVMLAKGYDLEYHEFGGPHSFIHWRSSLPLALVHMLGTSEGSKV